MNATNINIDDDKEINIDRDTAIPLSEEVIRTIGQVVERRDFLDDPSLSPVDFINKLFPTEQSLANVEAVMDQMKGKICNLDDEIRSALLTQIASEKIGKAVLLDAHNMIDLIVNQIFTIKSTAEQSEKTVKEIIVDIKQLDCAKDNLISTIATLTRLEILVRGIDTVRLMTDKRMYREVIESLQGVDGVTKYLQKYSDIPKVNQLFMKLQNCKETLAQQITHDFHEAITKDNIKNPSDNRRSLAEICLVIDILEPKFRNDLLNWFIERQLKEYLLLFNENEENSWLDKIDSRYTWFKKHLIQFERKFLSIFPTKWEVCEMITVKFCLATKSELAKIMTRRVKEIDVKLLLYAFQKTTDFEQLLAVRFSENTDSEKNNDEKETSYFYNIIGEAFQPYFYIFIDNLDKSLYEMIEKFEADSKTEFNFMGNQGVLSSCADLFVFYKKYLVQCIQLSNERVMLSLSATFGKYLCEYAGKILHNNLPKLADGFLCNSSSAGLTNMTRDIYPASCLFQSFLKEGKEVHFSKAEIAKICCILSTAEYCTETTIQLEEKIKNKVDPSLADKVDLSREQATFLSIISNCVQLLVSDLDLSCQTALNEMTKILWRSVETAGDQSDYVTTIISHLRASVPFVKESLSSSRKYFTQVCINFAKLFTQKFVLNLSKCKPLSIVGAEQLLLDTQTLKTALLDLPSLGSVVKRKAPDCYIQIVMQGMSHAEKILKLVMASDKPEASFVDQFLSLLPDSNIQEFQNVLDMKGLSATEKSNLLTVYCVRHSTGLLTNSVEQ